MGSLIFGHDSFEEIVKREVESQGGNSGGGGGGSSFTQDTSATKVELTKDLSAGSRTVSVNPPTDVTHAATKKYVDDTADAATIADSTDSGTTYTLRRNLKAGSYAFQSSAQPFNGEDLSNKTYVDSAISTGDDAVRTYVDGKTGPTRWSYFGSYFYLGSSSRVDLWPDMPAAARPPILMPLIPHADVDKLYIHITTLVNDYDGNEDLEGYGIDFIIWCHSIPSGGGFSSDRIYLGSKTLSAINNWGAAPTGETKYGSNYRKQWLIDEKFYLGPLLGGKDPKAFLLGYKISSGTPRGNEVTISFLVGEDI